MADSSYFPLDADETLGDAPSVGSRTARVRYSSALQEYGPPPLASVLDYYHDSEEDAPSSRLAIIKKNAGLFLLCVVLLIFLPHTFISFIFMYSTSQHMPLWLLLAPLVLFLYPKQSCSFLTGVLILVYAFWHDFSFFASVISLLCKASPSLIRKNTGLSGCHFPRVLWLCMPLQAKLYSAAMTVVQITIILVVRFSVSQVPRDDSVTLKRNWVRARAGALVIGICFLLMCCLDAARMGHPFSSTPTAMSNISAISIATSIRSFAALSACAISSEGRLFCSNSEFRLDSHGSVSVFDVIGMHDFDGAVLEYGFGKQLLLPSYMSDFGSRVEHVSVGGTHVCAVASGLYLSDRQGWAELWYWPWFMRDQKLWKHRNCSLVVCWGYNDHGQLGTGVATDADDRKYGTLREYSEPPDEVTQLSQFPTNEGVYQPSMLLPDDKVIHLATGHCHTCGLTLLGSLFCWGCNTFGQVGSPLHCPKQSSCNSPAAVSFSHMNTTSPISIAAAADNTCAIVGPHHVVVCWGRNNQAQLARSTELSHPFAPVDESGPHAYSDYPWFVDGLPDGAVSLALGREHACASFTDAVLRCWGSNRWGQLGESACGADSKCRRPVVVHLRKSSALVPQVLSSICAGNRITCGLADSALYCLGAFVNRSRLNHPLGSNDALPHASLHLSDNAVSLACSVNDRSPRFSLVRPHPEWDELEEYDASVSKYAVRSMGLVEGICVMNSSGHVRCIEGQFCSENGDSCTNGSFAAASFAQHERLVVDVEVGVLLFLGHTWHLLFYYRYFLLTLLKRMFPSKARDPDEGSHQITEMASMEQHPDCCAQMEFMGFPSDAARQAAAATGGDLDAAVDWLQEHPGAPYEDVLRFLDLNVIEKVGRGGFGSVYKCSRPLQRGISIAVKVISYANNSKDAQHATREGQRLANCDHENIVRMYKPHQPSKFPGICVLEMEFVAGGDLRRHLQHRLPHDVVKRFTIQLLNALVYLHDNKQLLHGDIKPHNILIKCDSLSIDGCVDYSNSVLKLADFGLAKSFASEASNDSTTRAGAGTAPYMSSEALRGQPRCCADDLWSACLVILEMDTGMPLQQLMQGLGSVNINALLIHASSDFLPMLHSVLIGNDASRRRSARDLLRHLEFCVESIFEWQAFDGSEFLAVSAAAAFVLENAFTAGSSTATLQLPPPLDLEFDIRAVCDKADGLGTQTHALSGGHPCAIRRMLKQSVNSIPVWQQLNSGTYWRQCSPQLCAKLEFESQVMQRANVVAHSRRLLIQPDTLGPAMIPFPLQREAYCVTLVSNGVISHPFASPADIDALAAQVHQSLPEFDITNLEAVVNQTLERKYAAYRHRIALRCNGNPNERFLFHFCPESIIPKIWQEGDGHDPRLSQWAEVGKGAYFSEHVIYGYAYRFNLWEGAAEPAIGQSFRVFVTLVALGNCKDLGVGCGTCTSPEWEEWKTEFVPMRIDNPTRPPGFSLPSDAGQCKHLLDLMGVRDRPRYDSVMSTEGDLGTSPASTYMNKARTHLVRDVMHPRLLLRPRDWGRQYVVFETSACYPMYILTLTKQRDAHGALNSRSH